ncbi:MAG: Zn-ribbon domain-containing OB-fold protein [Hyphomicrobiales bacterium]|nr:Zn-ribbon domain-containing OB-fold protein [Hyphomicrobiales bacterium]MCP5370293.1 Zn-ribbon domain-containing OB-fold protein [Hyphomicrobiales bacterium]
MSTPTPPARRPIRDGLFVDGDGSRPPRLLGSRCRETGEVFFPAERFNPTTRRAGTMEPVEIDGAGRIHACTVVRRGLPGFDSPYGIAVVQLDAGPSLIAQVEADDPAALAIGTPVRLTIGRIKRERDGTEVVGPKFTPAGGGASA